MSDLKNMDELDSYGVWVKTPPKTVISSEENKNDDSFNLDTDLPDFSSLDIVDENQFSDYESENSSLSQTELSAIENMTFDAEKNSATEDEKTSETGEQEISLDEFIEGGIFETGPDENKIKEKEEANALSNEQPVQNKKIQQEKAPEEDIAVSLDAQEEPVEQTVQTSQTSQSSQPDSDDDIFDIDFSFDDDSTTATSPIQEENKSIMAGTEEVNLSEFDIDDSNSGDSSQENSKSSSLENTEEVNLSEFGFDDTSENNSTGKVENKVELYPLESSAQENATIQDEQKEEEILLKDENEDFSVIADEDKTQEDEVSNDFSNADFKTAGEDDFDVQSILDNVEDENAKALNTENQENALVKTIDEIPTEKDQEIQVESENITDFNDEIDTIADSDVEDDEEIPDTFDEETSSFLDDDEILDEDMQDFSENEDSTGNGKAEKDDQITQNFADSIKAPILDEDDMGEQKPSEQMNAMFSQIVGELSALKDDIASLKKEFEDLKTAKDAAKIIEDDGSQNDEGFFDLTDEDDTIALSTDELDNILNSADITQANPAQDSQKNESVEVEQNQEILLDEDSKQDDKAEHTLLNEDETKENKKEEHLNENSPEFAQDSSNENEELEEKSQEENETELSKENILGNVDSEIEIPEDDFYEESGLSMDFSTLEEDIDDSSLENIDYTETQDSQLPQEISIPKPEDILVDSSSTDFMNESEVSNLTSSEGTQKEIDPFEELTKEDPPITESLTEEKIDYLSEEPLPEELAKDAVSGDLKEEIKSVLSYMDQLLENLPEEKIAEFAKSEQFNTYKKLFKELGLS